MANYYSITQACDRLAQIIQEAKNGEFIQITHQGKPVAVLLSQEAYQNLTTQPGQFGVDLASFRETYQVEDLAIDPEQIFEVRDQSLGREISL